MNHTTDEEEVSAGEDIVRRRLAELAQAALRDPRRRLRDVTGRTYVAKAAAAGSAGF
jgi:hypothetical protein